MKNYDPTTLGIKFVSAQEIVHNDSLSSKVFRLWQKDGGSYILKYSFNKDRFRRELYYLKLLKNVIPIPKVIDTFYPENEFQGAILMEDIKGHLLKSANLTEYWSALMGENLAKLHLFKVESYGDLSLENAKKSDPVLEMKNYFEEALIECKSIVENALRDKCQKYFDSNFSCLFNVDGPHIVHRDFRPGNIIVKDEKIQAVIDFESSKGSFAEEDFAQMQMLAWQLHPETKKSFLEGYSKIRTLPDLDQILPLLSMLRAMGAIGFTYERGTWQGKHEHVYQQNISFLTKFFN